MGFLGSRRGREERVWHREHFTVGASELFDFFEETPLRTADVEQHIGLGSFPCLGRPCWRATVHCCLLSAGVVDEGLWVPIPACHSNLVSRSFWRWGRLSGL
jgi:hypothetical protein